MTDLIERRVLDVAAQVSEQDGKAVGLKADVRAEADMDAAVQAGVTEFGRLDIMFANAGVARRDSARSRSRSSASTPGTP